jgi:hypothetical protein
MNINKCQLFLNLFKINRFRSFNRYRYQLNRYQN